MSKFDSSTVLQNRMRGRIRITRLGPDDLTDFQICYGALVKGIIVSTECKIAQRKRIGQTPLIE